MSKKGIIAIVLMVLTMAFGAWLGGIYQKQVVEAENIQRIEAIYKNRSVITSYEKYKLYQSIESSEAREDTKFFIYGYLSLNEEKLDVAEKYFEKSIKETNFLTSAFVRYYNYKFLAEIKAIQGDYISAKVYTDEVFRQFNVKDYNFEYRRVWDVLSTLKDIPEGNRILSEYIEEILRKSTLTRKAQSYYLRRLVALSVLENNYLVATECIVEIFNIHDYPNEYYYKGKAAVDLAIISKNLGASQKAIQILESIDVEIENPLKEADLEVYKLINLAQNKTLIEDYAGASVALERVEEYIDRLTSEKRDELKVSVAVKKAKIAVAQGKLEEAKQLLEETDIKGIWENIRWYTTVQSEYMEDVAEICIAEEKYPEAIAIYKMLLKRYCDGMNNVSHKKALVRLNEIFEQQGNKEAAKEVEQTIKEYKNYWSNLRAEMQYNYVIKMREANETKLLITKTKIKNYVYLIIIALVAIIIIRIKLLPCWYMKHLRNKIKGFMLGYNYFLVYQPIIDPKTERIIGLEALLRLKEGEKVIYPSLFIPEIEKAQMMGEVALWELREINRDYQEFKTLAEVDPDFYISINLSLNEITDPSFIEKIKQEAVPLLKKEAKICIEITENVGVLDEVLVKAHITELIEYGFKIAIDDFGVEYSNISMLDEFDFHTLKLDKHFIDNIKDSVVVQYLIKVINELSHELEINIVVEGVEEEWQKELVKKFSSSRVYIQGYYYSKPLTLGQLKEYKVNKSA